MKITGAIPCHNAAAWLPGAVDSVRAQSHPVDRLLVVDDGSTDGSAEAARAAGAEVIALPSRQGRGAARDEAMRAAGEGLVLFCDAGSRLPGDFAERAAAWFRDERVAAVYGPIRQASPRNAAERWRGRHLIKENAGDAVERGAPLITTGCAIRCDAATAVGGFDRSMVAGEDGELGARLLAAGFDVVKDPALAVETAKAETIASVLERYARWNTGEPIRWAGYLRLILFSAKVMARADLSAGDFGAAAISLLAPHYQFVWSWRVGWKRAPGGRV
jgi:glycosyltransferase involved in cell wall biosynthesis